jgi:hypothetical protein
LGPLFFLLYINDTIKIVNTEDYNNKSKLVLFAGDISSVISSSCTPNFIKDINGVFKDINWFKANLLLLTSENTSLILFLIKNSSRIPPVLAVIILTL